MDKYEKWQEARLEKVEEAVLTLNRELGEVQGKLTALEFWAKVQAAGSWLSPIMALGGLLGILRLLGIV